MGLGETCAHVAAIFYLEAQYKFEGSKTCKLRIDYAKILKRIWNICESRTLTSYSKNSVAGNRIFGKDHGKQNTQPRLVWSLVICKISITVVPIKNSPVYILFNLLHLYNATSLKS